MKGTKLTLQVEDRIASIEIDKWDCSATDIMELLAGVMVSQTWHPETIYKAMIEYGEEHLNENEN